MGEFIVRDKGTFILMQFEEGSEVETVTSMAKDLMALNGGKTVIARIGEDLTIVIDGLHYRVNPDTLGDVLYAVI